MRLLLWDGGYFPISLKFCVVGGVRTEGGEFPSHFEVWAGSRQLLHSLQRKRERGKRSDMTKTSLIYVFHASGRPKPRGNYWSISNLFFLLFISPLSKCWLSIQLCPSHSEKVRWERRSSSFNIRWASDLLNKKRCVLTSSLGRITHWQSLFWMLVGLSSTQGFFIIWGTALKFSWIQDLSVCVFTSEKVPGVFQIIQIIPSGMQTIEDMAMNQPIP